MGWRPEPQEEPERSDDDPKAADEPQHDALQAGEPRRRRIPSEDPRARESGKRYMRADAALKVTLQGGDVATNYAPADLIARIAGGVSATLKAFGGGFTPMLYAVEPGRSMTLVFGDPDPLAAQSRLPVEITLSEAERVGELIELEDDDLFARALLIGTPMRQYSELAQVLQSEGVGMRWEVRGQEPRTLSSARAQRHHRRLSAPPVTQDRPLTVNGVLYRVITESTREGYVGSVGIHLHEWSARPPGERKPRRIIALYESRDVEDRIKEGLIGEPVEATLLIRSAVPGTSIDPERFDLVLSRLELGPPDGELTGSFFEDIGE